MCFKLQLDLDHIAKQIWTSNSDSSDICFPDVATLPLVHGLEAVCKLQGYKLHYFSTLHSISVFVTYR